MARHAGLIVHGTAPARTVRLTENGYARLPRGGGGAHMRMHASSVSVAMSVCAMQPPTHCDNLFFVFYVFYQSKLEGFVF